MPSCKMVIDFHAHVFPDRIAAPTIKALAEVSGNVPTTDGTLCGLVANMCKAGVDLSVNLPVLTKPSQFDGTNRFALDVNQGEYSDRIVSFAGIHPACEDVAAKIKWLKKEGFLGIKIHPDYQGTFVDDEAYYQIVKCAKDCDMVVVTHAGVDEGFPGHAVKCTPQRAAALIDRLGGYSKLVLAHLGGNKMADEVEKHLVGKDVCFDTAYVLKDLDRAQFCRIVDNHGADKILFATDCPWSDVGRDLQIIREFARAGDLDKILCRNAMRLIGKEN